MPGWRVLAAVTALTAYGVLSHLLMVDAPDRPWTLIALFGPLLFALAVGGWSRRHLPTLGACAALAAALLTVTLRGGVEIARLYVLQHASIHLALAWTFAITLRRGSKPLISAMAERLHTEFTPAMRDYTRRLTGLWVLYFLAMVPVSLAIYMLTPWSWWSLYCNLLTPLAALALFIGEYLVRIVRHPEFERVSLARIARAYRAEGAPDAR